MNKFIILIISLLFYSCIEDYLIKDSIEFESKIVIDAHIVKSPDKQTQEIIISKSSGVTNRSFIPYSNCYITLYDNQGNEYNFTENYNQLGHYYADIPYEALVINEEYWIEVVSPNGNTYKSSIESLNNAPEIDSIYYIIEHKPTKDPDIKTWGVQFYVDFKADFTYSQHYLFKVEEAYEYHSQWPIQKYIDEYNNWIDGPIDFSKYICYTDHFINELFTLSTNGFTENSYIKLPLHFVNNKTQRLIYNYSIILKQYSISQSPFTFWNSIKENNQSGENLFGKQPSSIKGNITCMNNPDEIVLGYFAISKVTEKRFTINGGVDIPFSIPKCTPTPLEFVIPEFPRPLYLQEFKENGETTLGFVESECVNCTLLGGSLNKPDFFN